MAVFFHSPKSAILPSVIGNFDDFITIGASDWHRFLFSCLVGGRRLKKRKENYIPSRKKLRITYQVEKKKEITYQVLM